MKSRSNWFNSVKQPLDIYSSFAGRSERYWLGVIAVFVIISRWVGHMQYLYLSDSIRYALALDKYDVTIQQPHPPGYALYILFAKPFYWLFGDANTALIVISIIFSVLSIYTIFYLAKRIYSAQVAWISILIFVTSSIVWFHGQVALNYIIDAFFASWFAIYAYDSLKQSKPSTLLKASLVLAIGGGFRPTLVILMLPLWLWMILRRKNIRTFFVNTSIVLTVTLAWVIPAALLSGGLQSFWDAIYGLIFAKSALYSFSAVTSGIGQMWKQFSMIINNLVVNFGLALLFVLLWFISFIVPRMEDAKVNFTNLLFWSLWIFPALLFYTLVIFTLPGYLLIIIPALTIIIAKIIEVVAKDITKILPKLTIKKSLLSSAVISIIMIFIIGTNVYIYLSPSRKMTVEFTKPNYFTIDSMNRMWDELIPTIKREFNPQSTLVGVSRPYLTWGLPHFQYYLPRYPTYSRILWGITNKDDMRWYSAYKRELKLVETVDVLPTDAKMIIVGDHWNIESYQFEEVQLANDLGKILYYDLTDPEIKKLIIKVKGLRIIGGEVEENQEIQFTE